jgi:hypothetical protein
MRTVNVSVGVGCGFLTFFGKLLYVNVMKIQTFKKMNMVYTGLNLLLVKIRYSSKV